MRQVGVKDHGEGRRHDFDGILLICDMRFELDCGEVEDCS
jgi:hypothetical protein